MTDLERNFQKRKMKHAQCFVTKT